jgi:maltose alpha-D-glucosyltransferase/alpha-amylase
VPFCDIGDNRPWIAVFETPQQDATARYVLPMQIEWVRFDRERFNPKALAAVRQGAREGTLLDVATEQIFIGLFLRNLSQNLVVEENNLRLEFKATSRFADYIIKEPERIRAIEQSNSTALVDNQYVAKIYRQLEGGINPEIEIGSYLTDVAHFANTPALLGSVELVEGNEKSAIGVVHAFVANQGDLWTVSASYLDRFVEEQRLLAASIHPGEREEEIPYLRYMSQAGRRVAELHIALAGNSELAEFAPEPAGSDDVQRWIDDLMLCAGRVFDALRQRRETLREADRPLADQVLALQPGLPNLLETLLRREADAANIRCHGDLDLTQLLIVKDDIFIVDFEGAPRRSIAERRRKAPAARDIASLVRSIDYSATAALERALKVAHDEHGKLGAALGEWRDRAAAAFLAAYHEAMTDRRLWPSDPNAADGLLTFFLLEKALNEIEHELSFRPEWLRVPLIGIIRMLSQPSFEAS